MPIKTCEKCNKVFADNRRLKYHQEHVECVNKQKNICDKCGKDFKFPSKLKEHQKQNNICGKLKVEAIEKPEKNQCIYCFGKFSSKYYLTTHELKCPLKEKPTGIRVYLDKVAEDRVKQDNEIKLMKDNEKVIKEELEKIKQQLQDAQQKMQQMIQPNINNVQVNNVQFNNIQVNFIGIENFLDSDIFSEKNICEKLLSHGLNTPAELMLEFFDNTKNKGKSPLKIKNIKTKVCEISKDGIEWVLEAKIDSRIINMRKDVIHRIASIISNLKKDNYPDTYNRLSVMNNNIQQGFFLNKEQEKEFINTILNTIYNNRKSIG